MISAQLCGIQFFDTAELKKFYFEVQTQVTFEQN